MKKTLVFALGTLLTFFLTANHTANGCTNFLISSGASADGSVMITYAADSHVLYGELYFRPAKDYPDGTMLDIYEWDTGKYLGKIKQVRHTYTVIGNMNEHQVAIGETTYGGRSELRDTTGIIDYGSLMYITLQRAKTAREAIKTIAELLNEYGYYSSGESFSISDPHEAWIMEMIGKGERNTGAVWVARRVPDGYICGHANQARITTFPLENDKTSISSKHLDKIFDPVITTVYAADVIDVARKHKFFKGKNKDFSFADAYAPLDFGAARFCEARVWSGFNKVTSGMEKYLPYAMGEDFSVRMPLWVKPDTKLTVHDVMEMMRDHYENTPMDMTKDLGAGPFACGVRWRPLTWNVDGRTYFNERAISTQQTGFSFIAQSRKWLKDPIGGIFWFGVDDTYSTVYTPMYCGITDIPWPFAEGNGSMMEFSDESAFWIFNQVSNFAYTRYNVIMKDIQKLQSGLETSFINEVPAIDKAASSLYEKDPNLARTFLTNYSVSQGNRTFEAWKKLYAFLFTKYMDGNIKEPAPVPEGYIYHNPKLSQPGYGEEWYRKIVKETGDKFLYKGHTGH
ncbi:MAG: dipeptidase [Chlorobi bacterium]|nr:dipeptidase [Chlorobiota bacterium]